MQCPRCGTLASVSVERCPSCGLRFPKKPAPQEIPFLLRQGEVVLLDASSIQYYGVGIENIGFIAGGVSDFGLFGGVTSNWQKKREKSMLDMQWCHVYLTNLRIIFVEAKTGFFSSKETKLGKLFSEIPLGTIEGVYAGTKLGNPTTELSVKSTGGEIDKIAFCFSWVSGELRIQERDNWIKSILRYKSDLQKNNSNEDKRVDPLQIIRLRYAKGEITKEQYEQMRHALSE